MIHCVEKHTGGRGKVLDMDKQNYLSNLSRYEGLSLREIAQRSGHHFNTVKKYVDKEDWNVEYKPRKQRGARLEPLKSIIITTNLEFARWNDIFADTKITAALLDRIIDTAVVDAELCCGAFRGAFSQIMSAYGKENTSN